MLNGINEKELSKDNHVKIQNFPKGTRETVLDKVEELFKRKPDSLIVHETNDIAKGKNVLTNVKKNLKKVKKCSPETKVVFSGLIVRKDKNNIHKDVIDRNARLKYFCSQNKLIVSKTPTLTKAMWVPKSFTTTRKAIQCLRKT